MESSDFRSLLLPVNVYYKMSRFFCKLHRDMNRVNVFAVHRCINEGYGLIQISLKKYGFPPTKLWRVWLHQHVDVLHLQASIDNFTLCPHTTKPHAVSDWLNPHSSGTISAFHCKFSLIFNLFNKLPGYH